MPININILQIGNINEEFIRIVSQDLIHMTDMYNSDFKLTK